MRIFAVDVGAQRWGWCYADKINELSGSDDTVSFSKFYSICSELIRNFRPDILVVGKPNRYYNVISCQNKYIGVLCLIAEKKNIPLVEINDSTARAAILPKKGTSKKEEIMKLLKIDDPDQCDATVLARGWLKMNR